MRLRYRRQRECAVEGCDRKAPGTHPFCREHRAGLDSAEYRRLRVDDLEDDEADELAGRLARRAQG